MENFILGSSKKIIRNIFSLTYVKNTGVSFGLFKGFNWFFIITSIVALIFFIYIYLKKHKYPIQIAMIAAGITGNLIDRLFLGSVVDFLDFKIWPIFNIADSAISIGIIGLIIAVMRSGKDLL
jgi:signal peptidase II